VEKFYKMCDPGEDLLLPLFPLVSVFNCFTAWDTGLGLRLWR